MYPSYSIEGTILSTKRCTLPNFLHTASLIDQDQQETIAIGIQLRYVLIQDWQTVN